MSKRAQNDLRRRSPQSPNQRGSRRTPENKRTANDVRRRSLVAVSAIRFIRIKIYTAMINVDNILSCNF